MVASSANLADTLHHTVISDKLTNRGGLNVVLPGASDFKVQSRTPILRNGDVGFQKHLAKVLRCSFACTFSL